MGVASYGPQVQLSSDSDVLRDDFFGYEFTGPNGAAVKARRVPEYCQWEETRHVHRHKVRRTGEDIL